MFTYEEYYVKTKLSLFVKKLWTLNNAANSSSVLGKSVLPNGCFNIAIINGQGLLVKHQTWEKHLTTGVYYCGQMTEAVKVDILPNTKATMVQLYPWTPVHFISSDIGTYTNNIVSIELLALTVSGGWNSLLNLSYAQICHHLFTAFRPLLHINFTSALINQACRMILDTCGNMNISEIARGLQCSTRHLQKVFKKHIGLSPKELAVIVKLREAVDQIAYPNIEKSSLTHVALSSEFYDQAHFNNTFQTIVKTSPRKFNLPNYLLSLKR